MFRFNKAGDGLYHQGQVMAGDRLVQVNVCGLECGAGGKPMRAGTGRQQQWQHGCVSRDWQVLGFNKAGDGLYIIVDR